MLEGDGTRESGLLTGVAEPKSQNMKDALLMKREALLSELKELDIRTSSLQQEYSVKLDELQTKKKPLEEALHHIEALLRYEGYHVNSVQPNKDAVTGTGGGSEISITDAAFGLLQELHQSLHYKDIALKLQERNVYIPGRNPAATLLSRITRDRRFKRAKGRGVYGLSTWRMRATKRKHKAHKTRKR